MLHDFLIASREEILTRSRQKLIGRKIPTPTQAELANGLPLFLDQLVAILRAEKGGRDTGDGHGNVIASASLHGGELLRMGLTVGQVVHDYGSICQSVTELADERNVAITADEFQTFNRCLDDAIAQAVTSYQDQRDLTGAGAGAAHLGFLAHEMRNLLTTSMLTFNTLERGSVGIQGSTGALLGRSLRRMRMLIDRTLAEVRIEEGVPNKERISISQLIEEVEIIAALDAKGNDIHLLVDSGSSDLAVDGDHQILAAVLVNLVQNAFKFTRRQGHITVRAHAADDRILIEVQDECGGLPPGKSRDLFRPFKQRGDDRTGLGLGLSISLRGVRASGGELHVRDLPGSGCMFTVDLPKAAPVL